MLIIKVVHKASESELMAAKQAFTLETYRFDWKKFAKSIPATSLAGALTKELGLPFGRGFLKAAISLHADDTDEMYTLMVVEKAVAAAIAEIQERTESARIISLEMARIQFPRTNNLSIGTYTLHPFDSGRLTRLENYHSSLAMEKDDELIVLLGRMGAKSIRIFGSKGKSSTFETKAEIGISSKDISPTVNAKKVKVNSDELLVIFEGNVVEVDENLLQASIWFSSDSRLNSILASRRFSPNKIQQYSITTTYSESFDFDFELAAKVLPFKNEIKAQYASLASKECTFHVEFG